QGALVVFGELVLHLHFGRGVDVLDAVGHADLTLLLLHPRQRHEHEPLPARPTGDLDRHPHRGVLLAPHAIDVLDLPDLASLVIGDALAGAAAQVFDSRGHDALLPPFYLPRLYPAPPGPHPTPSTARIGLGSTPSPSA